MLSFCDKMTCYDIFCLFLYVKLADCDLFLSELLDVLFGVVGVALNMFC